MGNQGQGGVAPGFFDTELTVGAPSVAAVPEPSTWVQMLLCFGGPGFIAYRRKQKAALIAA